MISLCMAYRDRQAQLDVSLEAYRRLYQDLEISICDDGSPIPVEAPGCVVTSFPGRDYALNPCAAFNRAVEASHGDLIVLTNPEIEHREPIIEQMRESVVTERHYVIAAARDGAQWRCHSTYKDPNWKPFPPGAGPHYCVMFTRKLWEDAGGFDEAYRQGRMCDDNDWAWRAWRAGAVFVHRDDLIVHSQSHPKTVWPQRANYQLLDEKWSHCPEYRDRLVGVA